MRVWYVSASMYVCMYVCMCDVCMSVSMCEGACAL